MNGQPVPMTTERGYLRLRRAWGAASDPGLATAAVSAMASDQVAALSTDQVSILNTTQIAALGTEQVAALTSAQLGAITFDQGSAGFVRGDPGFGLLDPGGNPGSLARGPFDRGIGRSGLGFEFGRAATGGGTGGPGFDQGALQLGWIAGWNLRRGAAKRGQGGQGHEPKQDSG